MEKLVDIKSLRIPQSFTVKSGVKAKQVSACKLCVPTGKIADRKVDNGPTREAGN